MTSSTELDSARALDPARGIIVGAMLAVAMWVMIVALALA